ncbi:nucleoredoxin-like protein 2 isoform X1 [Panthera pardus]|uniref:Nucleoredoxin-like protein 2 isoform X1 n=1 Tax=Panthera pardus TaxID=9691 RepID=A0A9V1GBU6_PANPR|nr:nucleoredoxin-like protein 2 isoform X1 [Panthera pardus]
MVDVLGGRRLLTRDGAWVEAEEELQNKVVALYFAAGWCAPSRDFTPLLCHFYAQLVAEARPPAPFAVVFVSADGSAQEMLDFMRELHGAWLALPFHDPFRQVEKTLTIEKSNSCQDLPLPKAPMRNQASGPGDTQPTRPQKAHLFSPFARDLGDSDAATCLARKDNSLAPGNPQMYWSHEEGTERPQHPSG